MRISDIHYSDMGRSLAACNKEVSYAIDAATTEALGIRRGVVLANEMGFDKIIAESDCLEAMEEVFLQQ